MSNAMKPEEVNTNESSDETSDFDSDESSSADSADLSEDKVTKQEEKLREEEEDEEEDNDPVVKAIRFAKSKKLCDSPQSITLDSMASTLCFHAERDILATGDYGGSVELWMYNKLKNEKMHAVAHAEATRELCFSSDGKQLFAAYGNKDLIFYKVDGLYPIRTIKDATEAPASSMLVIDENILAIGDDDGGVKLWDKRKQTQAVSLRVGEDAITSMVTDEDGRILVCSSQEGFITTIKIRGGKVDTQSEQYEDHFNCLGTFKQNSKLAVGDSVGKLYLFDWGSFAYHSDVYPGYKNKEAINAMIPITERIVITGSDDGFLRAMHLFPQKSLGVVGRQPDPVDKMDVCNDGHLIACLGHMDETIRFWNVDYLEGFSLPLKKEKSSGKVNKDFHLPSSKTKNATDFFKDLAD